MEQRSSEAKCRLMSANNWFSVCWHSFRTQQLTAYNFSLLLTVSHMNSLLANIIGVDYGVLELQV
jgi:hypothetical protein